MIRKMTEADLDRVMEIWLDACIEGQSFISEDYWKRHADVVRKDYIPQSEVYVDERSGEISGFIAVVGGRHIGALFVAPDCWHQGIGRGLVEYALKHYKGRITLAAYVENTCAVNFYRQLGFEVREEEIEAESGHREYIMQGESK
ncbi:N-acetyltransferase [Eubacterium sp. 1001713B170207_170306_E7]|uniref:N-acetyltransferase n=1 Tax=Eubacterium sp. 1001713B170207_170306_E7 TaxID=2787097 RepID=UPI00189C29A5|nr:N-acetyltransferase [Eubacterium sp. 1001713B170207_170306_E7]